MESQVHYLEKEAYFSVLRAFKAQADAITWDKEGLITELRKELRVSDEEHREILGRVNSDDLIRKIREWRQAGAQQGPMLSSSQTVHDVVSTPAYSLSRKKQKTSQPHSVGLQPSSAVTMPPAGSYASRGRKPNKPPTLSVSNSRNQYRRSSVALPAHETEGHGKELIGRTVFTKWPDDNTFYEAVISNYDPNKDMHALIYDKGTDNEAWEWVDLKQMPPEDIRWVGEDPGISYLDNHEGPKSARHLVRGAIARKEFDNGAERVAADDIEMLHTDTLIKEVQKVVDAAHPDLLEIQRAKKILKEHELSLVDAISRLTYVSEDDSDGEIPI
ncbi:hypothetical protein Droror1_Dr00014729 [Drosera rotundifolia]